MANVHDDVGHFRSVAAVSKSIAPELRQFCQRPIEDAWVEFLKDYEWQWFATLTFKDAVHPEAAGKKFKYWTKLIDESHGVDQDKPLTHRKRCVWARGLEWQKRDVLHFHAVMGNLPTELDSQSRRFLFAETWLEVSGGIARIWPIEHVGGVLGYITKYCAKGGEIDLSPNLALAQRFLTADSSAR